jgi:hypothetical protein
MMALSNAASTSTPWVLDLLQVMHMLAPALSLVMVEVEVGLLAPLDLPQV